LIFTVDSLKLEKQNYIPKMPENYFGTHIPKDEHGYNKYIFGKMF
jgi:hypothetical protein